MILDSKIGRAVVVLGIALVLLPGCVAASKHYDALSELSNAKSELAVAEEQLMQAEGAIADTSLALTDMESQASIVADVTARNEELLAMVESLKLKAAQASPEGWDFIINEQEGLYGYRGAADIFFAAGSSTLTKEGQTRLATLAGELARHSDPIRIVGHTDSDPVKKTIDQYPEGNIQLGANRAISVRKFLISKGVAPGRMAVMSYGEHSPVESGNTAKAKEKNRRVEIMVEAWQTFGG